MTTPTKITDQQEWDALVDAGHGHPLQYWGWGELKSAHGWQAERFSFAAGEGAQFLEKSLPLRQKMLFCPRGPFGTDRSRLLKNLIEITKNHPNSFLKIEPEWPENPKTHKTLTTNGFKPSRNHIFIPKTAEIPLANFTPETYLSSLDKKTRQYINKSTRELDIRVISPSDTATLQKIYALYAETAARAHFKIHPKSYYQDLARLMGDHNRIYGAFLSSELTAFLWNIASATTEFELYGGVSTTGQKQKANYGLKWHAITTSASSSIKNYDMNGLLNDGIDGFKRHFIPQTGEITRIGTYDYFPTSLGRLTNSAISAARHLRRLI